jgi:hypothetical protein
LSCQLPVYHFGLSLEPGEHLAQEDGEKAAGREYAWERGQDRLHGGSVLVIDEAGMVDARQLSHGQVRRLRGPDATPPGGGARPAGAARRAAAKCSHRRESRPGARSDQLPLR